MDPFDEIQPHCSLHDAENTHDNLKQKENELDENKKTCFDEIQNVEQNVNEEEEEGEEEDDDVIEQNLNYQATSSTLADNATNSEESNGLQKLIMKQRMYVIF